jgi:hypothetical protein
MGLQGPLRPIPTGLRYTGGPLIPEQPDRPSLITYAGDVIT